MRQRTHCRRGHAYTPDNIRMKSGRRYCRACLRGDRPPVDLAARTPLRFYAIAEKTATCWLWTGATTTGGYGRFRAGGRHVLAHRWSYEHHIGPIPVGLELDHLCRNPSRVNPTHLEPVTRLINQQRAAAAKARTA